MKILKHTAGLLIALTLAFLPGAQAKEVPLELDVYQADGNSFYVSSVLVKGATEAVLIDAQFTLADAHQVVANILRSGKKLKSIYISHGDPDYYFGLQVIKQAFPDAKVFATEQTLAHIKKTMEKKLAFWGPKLGKNGPTKIILPEVVKQEHLTVDDAKLKIIGMDTHADRTFVWIPSIKAVVGGVPVYAQTHLWMADAATAQKRKEWLDILNEILAFNPSKVVPGHGTKDSAKTIESVLFSKAYLTTYEAELANATSSKQVIQAMTKKYPKAVLPIALDIGAKVSTGEMAW